VSGLIRRHKFTCRTRPCGCGTAFDGLLLLFRGDAFFGEDASGERSCLRWARLSGFYGLAGDAGFAFGRRLFGCRLACHGGTSRFGTSRGYLSRGACGAGAACCTLVQIAEAVQVSFSRTWVRKRLTQKSSFPQPAQFVSQALTLDTSRDSARASDGNASALDGAIGPT
jgi:hypothetical protein